MYISNQLDDGEEQEDGEKQDDGEEQEDGEEKEDRLEEEMMRPGRQNLLNVMNCAQTEQYNATFQKETWFCDFQHMNEQCI